jgi:hypothetical protein
MFHNYHSYRNVCFARAKHPESSKILVIRTEHMEADWNSAGRVIRAGDGVTAADDDEPSLPHIELNIPHLNVKEITRKEDTLLSTQAQVLLCEALCQEIQTYKQLLKEAVNLLPEDYDQSWQNWSTRVLYKSCRTNAATNHE